MDMSLAFLSSNDGKRCFCQYSHSSCSFRVFPERACSALYETPQSGNRHASRRRQQTATQHDISEYAVNEATPTDAYFKSVMAHLESLAGKSQNTLAVKGRYLNKWISWLKLGVTSIQAFETSIQTLMPALFSCWGAGAPSHTGLASA